MVPGQATVGTVAGLDRDPLPDPAPDERGTARFRVVVRRALNFAPATVVLTHIVVALTHQRGDRAGALARILPGCAGSGATGQLLAELSHMRMLRPFVPSLAMLLLATSGASAQSVLIDQSEIRFVSRQMGVDVEGRFRRWKASVDWKPNDLARSRADFEIDLSSIDLASEESETELRRPRWLDVARFPVATFASSAMKDLGGDRYEIAGRLTMKGEARNVAVPVQIRRDPAGNAVAEGQFTIKRLDFNVGDAQWADSSAVADDVLVRVRMVLPRAA